jgi:hypothetical protein
VLVPPVDHDCSLRDIVVAMSNKIAKLEHELAQLKKAHIGPKSERGKMPRVPTKPPTPEERLAKRRAQAADRAQTETVRTEHKVPVEERTCPSCGNDKLKPIGEGRTTTVFEFVPARFVRHEHVQEVLALPLRRLRRHRAGRSQGDREGALRRQPARPLGGRKVRGPPANLRRRTGSIRVLPSRKSNGPNFRSLCERPNLRDRKIA